MKKITILFFSTLTLLAVSFSSFARITLLSIPRDAKECEYEGCKYEGIITGVQHGLKFDGVTRVVKVYVLTPKIATYPVCIDFEDDDLSLGHSFIAAIGKKIKFVVPAKNTDYGMNVSALYVSDDK